MAKALAIAERCKFIPSIEPRKSEDTSLRVCLVLRKLGGKKKIEKVNFLPLFGVEKKKKAKNMTENLMENLET